MRVESGTGRKSNLLAEQQALVPTWITKEKTV